jgi:hypothetical protein
LFANQVEVVGYCCCFANQNTEALVSEFPFCTWEGAVGHSHGSLHHRIMRPGMCSLRCTLWCILIMLILPYKALDNIKFFVALFNKLLLCLGSWCRRYTGSRPV